MAKRKVVTMAQAKARVENARVAQKRRQSPTDKTAGERAMRASSPDEKLIGLTASNLAEAEKLGRAMSFAGARCEEASSLSRGEYVPCGAPVSACVWHEKDRRVYQMCRACADHNVRNRGGFLVGGIRLVAKQPAASAMGLTVRVADVLKAKRLQDERKRIEADLEAVKAELKAAEAGIIAFIEAGVPFEAGCPTCAVGVEERVTPRWKDEAFLLAEKAGLDKGVYEAEVRARTVPAIVKRLIVNGR